MNTGQERQRKKLKLSGEEEGLDGLSAEIIGKILTFCQPEDAVKLRATSTKIKKEADALLYRISMQKVMKKPIKYQREFFSDNKAFITLVHDGKYRSKDEAIEFCVEDIKPTEPRGKTTSHEPVVRRGTLGKFLR